MKIKEVKEILNSIISNNHTMPRVPRKSQITTYSYHKMLLKPGEVCDCEACRAVKKWNKRKKHE